MPGVGIGPKFLNRSCASDPIGRAVSYEPWPNTSLRPFLFLPLRYAILSFAQALGGHRGHPFDAVRLTRVRGVQVGFLPT